MLRNYPAYPFGHGHVSSYVAIIVLLGTVTVWSIDKLFEHIVVAGDHALRVAHGQVPASKPTSADTARSGPNSIGPGSSGQVTLTQDEWHERLRSRDYWAGRPSSNGAGPTAPFVSRASIGTSSVPPGSANRDAASRYHDGDETTYRTMCVRLCDGYYWPVSFSTTEDNFRRDRVTCERSCGQQAKLFVYKNPGGEPADMRDLDGQPYSKLKTAFLYRSKFDAQCKCKADPWEQEAKDRHRLYALDAARLKGDKVAAKEAEVLRAKLLAEHKAKLQALAEQRRSITPNGSPAVLGSSSASIVAAAAQTAILEGRTLESVPALAPLAKPPAQAAPAARQQHRRQATASAPSGPPAGVMRLGGSSGSSSSGSGSSNRSSGGGDWRARAFNGN